MDFAHTAFLLCQTIMLYLNVLVKEQRLFMILIYNPYQKIFQLILNMSP